MKHVNIVRIPARLSRLGVTEIYYDYMDDDWRERADRMQARRWHHIRHENRVLHDKRTPRR